MKTENSTTRVLSAEAENEQSRLAPVISRDIDVFGNKEPFRALSWKEPFASLMLHGKIETRTWHTNYRGLVLICASKKGYSDNDLIEISGEDFVLNILGHFLKTKQRQLYHGKAIAIGRLVDCRRMKPEDEAKTFVSYRPELWCHIYEEVTAIEPIDWKGSQGWRSIPDYEADKLLDTVLSHGL